MSPLLPRRLLSTQSDERLVALARAGHERAFEILVQRYRRPLLCYCQRLLLPESRAEDALQQAWISAWQALSRGAEVREPRAWLYRIAHNATVSALRKSGYDYSELHESLTGADSPADDLERRIAVREALAGLASLPEVQREVLLRTAVEGQSYEQVATALGLTDGAVRGMIHRARNTMRAVATAVTPTPVAAWAASGGKAASAGTRLAETLGFGSAGVSGALVKTGVVALTAGGLVTGGVISQAHGHRGIRPATRVDAGQHRVGEPIAPSSSLALGLANGSRGGVSPALDPGGSAEGAPRGGPAAAPDESSLADKAISTTWPQASQARVEEATPLAAFPLIPPPVRADLRESEEPAVDMMGTAMRAEVAGPAEEGDPGEAAHLVGRVPTAAGRVAEGHLGMADPDPEGRAAGARAGRTVRAAVGLVPVAAGDLGPVAAVSRLLPASTAAGPGGAGEAQGTRAADPRRRANCPVPRTRAAAVLLARMVPIPPDRAHPAGCTDGRSSRAYP